MEELRRFHFGDPAATTDPPSPGTLPAALQPLRGRTVEGPWPLWIDPSSTGESWVRTLSADERAGAVAGTLAPPAGGALLPCTRRAALRLASFAAGRRLHLARAAFAAEARELALSAEALLIADRARRPEAATAAPSGTLGGLGERFVDPSALSRVVAHRRAGAPLSDDRRQRLEAARDRLASYISAGDEPLWIVPPGEATADLGAPAIVAAEGCAAAMRAFDEATREIVDLARAVRIVRLEVAQAFDAGRHGPWLERFDWRGLAIEELLLVRPVLVLLPSGEALAGELSALSRLLLSGRPIQVLLLTGDDAPEDPAADRLDAALLGLAHREAFVQQGSLAQPLELAYGLGRALASRRSALHVIDAPSADGQELACWLVAAARVAGRAVPLLRFDPESGSTWARRLNVTDNPAAAADWAAAPFAAEAASPEDPTAGAPFTFADAALLEPAWRRHFARAGDSPELVPLVEWLELAEPENVRRLPFVWGAETSGERAKLVLTRALALATRDRLAAWRTFAELAGVRSEVLAAAAERARAEVSAAAESARRALVAEQEAALAGVRAEADSRVVNRLVSVLFDLGSGQSIPLPAAATAVVTPPVTAQVAPAGAAAPAAPAAAPRPAAPVSEAAWIDSALCTSCDECVRKFPSIFVYNGNKQAVFKNPRGGSFRDLVVAAESCTAKVIHPGTPWDANEPDLARSLERARPFA